MNEFLEQFLVESRELIVQATDDLLALEERPGERDRLDDAFRAFHTLKGAAAIVEFSAMSRTFHAAEDVLAAVRSSEGAITVSIVDGCLACLDLTSRWLDAIQTNGETPTVADTEADAMISRLVASQDTEQREEVEDPGVETWLGKLPDVPGGKLDAALTAVRYIPHPDAFFEGHDPIAIVAGLPKLLEVTIALTDPPVSLAAMNVFKCNLEIVALFSALAADVRAVLPAVSGRIVIRELRSPIVQEKEEFGSKAAALLNAQLVVLREAKAEGLSGCVGAAGRTAAHALRYLDQIEFADEVERATVRAQTEFTASPLIEAIEQSLAAGAHEDREKEGISLAQASRTLRVDMGRIDAIIKLAGEIVILKNTLGHLVKLKPEAQDPALVAAALRDQHARFDRLALELQTAALRMRILPLRSVFRRFPKLVREIAASLGKAVKLITEGENTEADAAIVDALFEPLLHILRNAVDHGIESPERRASLGKPPIGTLTMRGRREGENIVIEIEDDGSGIDIDRVRAVAAERGVASMEALAAMTEIEAADLVFRAGFSTSATVTDLSGRGIGMDSVRATVERLGGRVALKSQAGTGTTVALVLPFSLMVTRIMTVEVAGQPFGLPLDMVLETTHIHRDRIVPIGTGRAFVLRNKTVPLLDLAEALGLPSSVPGQNPARIVVLSAGGQLAAIEVDRLGERMDVMLKPMGGLLVGMRAVAGTTLLGDGRVLIVLDAQGIFG